MADIATEANQALLDAAEWAGISVWLVIAAIAAAVLILLIVVVYLVVRESEPARAPASAADAELVERTIAEFPAEQVKIEAIGGNIVIKLVSPKPAPAEDASLPQEVKEEPMPDKVDEPESKPIAMGAAGSKSEANN